MPLHYGSENTLALPTTRLVLKDKPRRASSRKAVVAACLGAAVLGGAYVSTRPAADVAPTALAPVRPRPVHADPACRFRDGDRIALRADTGKFFASCRNCIPSAAYDDAAFVHASSAESALWTVVHADDGKIALQGETGKFLGRCRGCAPIATHTDEAFVHVHDWKDAPWAQWTCAGLADHKIALASDAGTYLSRCNNCVNGAYPDAGFVVAADATRGTAQWTVHRAPTPACTFYDGQVITLATATGQLLARHAGDQVRAAATDGPTATWKVFNTRDGELALQADDGQFLVRTANGAIALAASASASTAFRCVDVGGDRIALEADNGAFVAKLNGQAACARGTCHTSDLGVRAMDVDPSAMTAAQWTVGKD